MHAHIIGDHSGEDLVVGGTASSEDADSVGDVVDLSGGAIGDGAALKSHEKGTVEVRESLPAMMPLSYLMATMVV